MSDRMPKPMPAADLDALRASIHPVTHPSFAALLDAHDFWCALAKRGTVTARVVEAYGITPEKRDAWLRSRPEMEAVRETENTDMHWYRRGLFICTTRELAGVSGVIESISAAAAEFGLSWWEVVEQMAAMKVDHA